MDNREPPYAFEEPHTGAVRHLRKAFGPGPADGESYPAMADDVIRALQANDELRAKVLEAMCQREEAELAELRTKLQEANDRLRIASESNDLAVAKLQAAEAELLHTREAAELLRESLDPRHDGDSEAIVRMAQAQKAWLARDQKRASAQPLRDWKGPAMGTREQVASAATEERTKSVDDDDCPPGGRRVDVYLSGDRETLAFPGGAFTTVRACRHCGVLITGGPTACVHCVAPAEVAESKRGER